METDLDDRDDRDGLEDADAVIPVRLGRVLLGGLIAAVVLTALGGITALSYLDGFIDALNELGRPVQASGRMWQYWAAITLGAGLASVWIYAAILPRYGPGPETAAIAGSMVWGVTSLSTGVWVSFGVVDVRTVVIPMVANLVVFVLATMAGAWAYGNPAEAPAGGRDDTDDEGDGEGDGGAGEAGP